MFNEEGRLPLEMDPKMAWATSHPEWFPMEIKTAPYEMLVRVPGIGPLSAKRIVELRRSSVITDPRQLTKLGVIAKRAASFLLFNGRIFATPAPSRPRQMNLWSFPLTHSEEAITIGPTF